MEIDGWNPAKVTNDSGETSKKRTTKYSLPYPNGASPADKTSSLFLFETKDGSVWKPYTSITTADELKAISDNLDGSYVLENDITLSGDWLPLGMNDVSHFTGCFDVTGNYVIMADELDASGMETLCGYGSKFAGKLAGNGCKLTLSKPLFEFNSGLVMRINAAGTIDGSSEYRYGAIARENSGGTIYGCSFSGSLTAYGYAGGICGTNDDGGAVRNCYNTGTVTAQDEYAGGIVGLTSSSTTVSECYNTGSVSGNEYVGGIVGLSESASKISDCLNTGRITGENDVGGIVGVAYETTVTGVLNAGIAYAPGYYGCISGASTSDGSYDNCYFIAELSAANYSGKGTGVSTGNIAELNLGQRME